MKKEIKNFIISGILTLSAVIFISIEFLLIMSFPNMYVYCATLFPIFLFISSCYFSGIAMSSMGKEEDKSYNTQSVTFISGIIMMVVEIGMLLGFNFI